MRYCFDDCILDTMNLTLCRGGTAVPVEPQVFDLLQLLAENSGRVVTRDEIVAVVWGGRIVSESAISARIAAARKAVGDDGKRQHVIRTVMRRGLQMVADVTTDTGTDAPDVLEQPQTDATPRLRYARNGKGQSLAYAITGEGTPVVRMGYHTTDVEAEWRVPSERVFFNAIDAHHRLLRFDNIGSGQSDRNMTDETYDDLADNLRYVTDAAGFDRFALFSESGGAFEAVHFAAKYPERVSKLVIVGGYCDGRLRRRDDDAPDAMRSMIAEGWSDHGGGFVSGFMLAYFPEGPLDRVRDMARLMQGACTEEVMLKVRDMSNTATLSHLLGKVQCPTLIIHSRHDAVHPLSEAQKLAAGIPNSELLVLNTANHIPLPGNPTWDEFKTAFQTFLAEP